MTNSKLAEKVISLAGTAVLGTVFILWWANSAYSAIGYAAAIVSVCLMLALCLKFVPQWCSFWLNGCDTARIESRQNDPCTRIFMLILLLCIAILILGFIMRRILGYSEGVGEYLSFWLCTDSRHYMDIARDWYLSEGEWDRLVQLVFLPGYPVIVRIFAQLIGSCLAAGLIISALCFAGSGVMLYKLLALDMERAAALRAVKFFALSPAAFFFVSPMSESLFVLCTLSCLYLIRRGKVLSGSALGAYAAFTRSPGLILIVPIFFELVHRRARAREYLALIIVSLGFAAYCLINYTVAGDAFKFMEYQSVHWHQSLGWFFNTAAYQTENALSSLGKSPAMFWGLWLPNILAQGISLAVMTVAARKMRPSYAAYFIAYFAVTIGATWLLSAPRYLAAAMPIPAALAALSEHKRTERTILILSAAAFLAYFAAFLLRWQVW